MKKEKGIKTEKKALKQSPPKEKKQQQETRIKFQLLSLQCWGGTITNV